MIIYAQCESSKKIETVTRLAPARIVFDATKLEFESMRKNAKMENQDHIVKDSVCKKIYRVTY